MNALVAKVIDEYSVVINKGLKDGIKFGYRYIIYSEYGEVFDPETKESLGNLEVPKGYAEVESIQDRMTIIKSDRFEYKMKKTRHSFLPVISGYQEESEKVRQPFDRRVSVGDKVKIVR